jgi:hypothetical protein
MAEVMVVQMMVTMIIIMMVVEVMMKGIKAFCVQF